MAGLKKRNYFVHPLYASAIDVNDNFRGDNSFVNSSCQVLSYTYMPFCCVMHFLF